MLFRLGSNYVVQVRPTEFLLWPSQQLGYSCERRASSEGTNTKPKSSVPVVGGLVLPVTCRQHTHFPALHTGFGVRGPISAWEFVAKPQ